MSIVFKWLLLASAVVTAADAREWRVVQTAQGPVKGYKNGEIFEFFSIPYATAPTGTNRFMAPLPGPVWMHPLEAVNKKIICPQLRLHLLSNSHIMQENCLIANVYMPDTEETNLPVMVYVHGGAYQMGWGEMTTTHNLVKSKKIVAVTFNYRLGVHGYLCLGTESAPGNAGMKDQVALLRWVKKNIANFGGNPDDVTLVGSSAGSSAVDLLMLSEATAGLYNKVIPESGASVGVWSIQQNPLQTAKNFAKINNFHEVDNINALEEFYKTASYDVLVNTMSLEVKNSTFGFVPCVERHIGVETFLEDAPVNILKQGKYRKVPVLYGFASHEGLSRLLQLEKWKKEINDKFSDFLPADLEFKSEEERNEVAKIIKEFYFEDKPIGEDTVIEYVEYFSDVMFAYAHLWSTKLQVAAGSDSIYLYQYSFHSPVLPIHDYDEMTKKLLQKIRGADHCAQTVAVHDYTFVNSPDTSEQYLKMKRIMQEIWLNFITTGKPVPAGSNLPAWPPVGANRSPHMDLGEEIMLQGPLLEERAKFWDGIYERYYRMPVPPPMYSLIKTEL